MKLSIIILSYKTKDLVLDCIKSLEKNYGNEFKNNEFEIVIIDNASADGSFNFLKNYANGKKYIQVFESQENLGFGKGCNLGVSKAKGEFVLFLNSDTKSEDSGLIKMVNFMENNKEVGILGGNLINLDGTMQKSTGKFYTLFNFLLMIVFGERTAFFKKSPDKIEKVDWVTGACMMVNRKTFDELNGFDKDMFMYLEDMELCFRANKKGIKTFFYPETLLKHVNQGSSNRAFAIVNIYKGFLFFYKKNMPTYQYLIVKFCLWFKAVLIYIIGRITNNSYYISAYGQALKLF